MPPPALSLGQVLRGRLGSYTVSKKIYQDVVWLARLVIRAANVSPWHYLGLRANLDGTRDQRNELVAVKSVSGHPRVENERDVLKRFQSRSTHIRPLLDEIQDPAAPITIVLRHLDEDLLGASIRKTLNRKEIKFVARGVLEALSVLHADGYVHTDVKPGNILVNYKDDKDDVNEVRFSDVQLGDFGGSYHQESEWATSTTPIGAPMWSSPEVLMEIPWNTATDIWSFGTVVRKPASYFATFPTAAEIKV